VIPVIVSLGVSERVATLPDREVADIADGAVSHVEDRGLPARRNVLLLHHAQDEPDEEGGALQLRIVLGDHDVLTQVGDEPNVLGAFEDVLLVHSMVDGALLTLGALLGLDSLGSLPQDLLSLTLG